MKPCLPILLLFAMPLADAAGLHIACHVSHEGETRVHVARPVASVYGIADTKIGDVFLFRMTLQDQPADIAGVRIQTYFQREDGAVLIHQASYPWPLPRNRSRFGFTGLHRVFEPAYDGELEYWCEAVKEGRP